MKLEDIGFYTLNNERAKNTGLNSPMWRCEVIVTDKCNFKCPYCRGLKKELRGTMSLCKLKKIIDFWAKDNLKNIRFSGGEPTTYKFLLNAIERAKVKGIERIAISTNGSSNLSYYQNLIDAGVNDISISLDACCSSFGKLMSGGIDVWETLIENIKELSKMTYVTVGIVFSEQNIKDAKNIVLFAHSLGVDDIRIISTSQYNKAIEGIGSISKKILNSHPILKYRVNNFLNNRNVRGIQKKDSNKCTIVIDDSAVAKNYHFPCIIYMREYGNPIGKVGKNMRKERFEWSKTHNTHKDVICKKNCLDVCIDYNNKYMELHKNGKRD